MQKYIFIMSMLVVLSSYSVQAAVNNSSQSSKPSFHNDAQQTATVGSSQYNMIDVIKNVKIAGYPAATFGEAFESYRHVDKKEWREVKTKSDKVYVTFTGYFKKSFFNFRLMRAKVAQQGVEVKFVIFPDGVYEIALISRVDVLTNGTAQAFPVSNGKQILEKLLRNEEIKF